MNIWVHAVLKQTLIWLLSKERIKFVFLIFIYAKKFLCF